ncbi:MAG: WXG100 family type VII secretion target [Firmicutes bacterium]|nr:WXG100 family type VII secretion target [Bacillota bacterium]
MNIARWNLETLKDSIQRLDSESNNLTDQREQMRVQQERVDVSWRSPAGQQFQNRLQADMATIDNIINQLMRRIESLRRVHTHYANCENEVRTALGRLPV